MGKTVSLETLESRRQKLSKRATIFERQFSSRLKAANIEFEFQAVMADCEAVKLWRDTFKLNVSASWKRDVEITVKDLSLWKTILQQWKREHRHPGIKQLLDEYDRRKFNEVQSQSSGVHRQESLSQRRAGRVSESRMPALLERKRCF